MMQVDETTIPPRMSRIERLMKDLELLAESAGSVDPSEAHYGKAAHDARELILMLLGMADLPVGETIYRHWMRQKERAGEGAGDTETDLRNALLFTERWIGEVWPASEDGKVPFARALHEHLSDTVAAYLKRLASERATEVGELP